MAAAGAGPTATPHAADTGESRPAGLVSAAGPAPEPAPEDEGEMLEVQCRLAGRGKFLEAAAFPLWSSSRFSEPQKEEEGRKEGKKERPCVSGGGKGNVTIVKICPDCS